MMFFDFAGDSTHNFQSISLFFLQLQQKCVTFVTLLLFIQQPVRIFPIQPGMVIINKHIVHIIRPEMPGERATSESNRTVFRRFAKNILETKRIHINYS